MSYYKPLKKREPFDKRKGEILHAIKRARERYGLRLSKEDVESISKTIRTQATKSIKVVSNSRVLHELTYQGKTIKVLYDKKRHVIITFLPQ